jgi:hypothetical protein
MKLPHYTDRLYESCRQRRRYQTDPAFRLDRINRTRTRLGLPPYRSLLSARIRFRFEQCRIDVSRLRVAGMVPKGTPRKRTRRDRVSMLRKEVA